MSNKRRGPTYSIQEVDHLLDALREHLPMIGPEEWDLVASEHIRTWGENGRDTTSLRRKSNQLVKQKMGTGDPNCPPHVHEAKRIMISITKNLSLIHASQNPRMTTLDLMKRLKLTLKNALLFLLSLCPTLL